MKFVALVPIKLNNERLPGKNLKPLPGGGNLLTRILQSLSRVDGLHGIYVFCSDDSIRSLVEEEGARFLKRDAALDLPSATSNDILKAFAAAVPSDGYVLAHATAPFLSPASVQRGISAIADAGYDSSLSVTKLQTFYWVNGAPANYDPASIPRTQDLEPLLVETSGFYAFAAPVLQRLGRRVGDRPFLVEVSAIEALDVDDGDDFELVAAVAARGESRP